MNKILWGSASSAYQVEGAYKTDDKGPSIWDEYANFPGNTYENTNGNIACDHYNRYKEDIKLMKECNLKAYRFSISWTRILPNGKGTINKKGIQFYQDVCKELTKNNIEPIITLYHWDLPLALQNEYNGWESYQIIEDFLNYVSICFESFHQYVKYWIIINEPNIFTEFGYLLKQHPPKKNNLQTYLQVFHHTAIAHAKSILLFKEKKYEGKIGSSIAYTPSYSHSNDDKDLEALEMYQAIKSDWYLESYYNGSYPKKGIEYYQSLGINLDIKKEDISIMKQASQLVDFIGINNYQSTCIVHDSNNTKLYKEIKDPTLNYTDWNWSIDPKSFTKALIELHNQYHLPILISENGLGAYDKKENNQIHDPYRIHYLKQHIQATLEAQKQGVNIIGYCVWSFTDLLSWLNGYEKRYGLVYIDFENQLQRSKKDSFYWYKKVIETDGKQL